MGQTNYPSVDEFAPTLGRKRRSKKEEKRKHKDESKYWDDDWDDDFDFDDFDESYFDRY